MQRRRYPEAHDVRRARKESFRLYIISVIGHKVGRVETGERTRPTLPTSVCPDGNWVRSGPVESSNS